MPKDFEVVCDASNNSQADLDKGILNLGVRVLARALVGRTAGQLRAARMDVDADVPDCAVLGLSPDGKPVFNWITASYTMNPPSPGFRREIFDDSRDLRVDFERALREDPIR